MKRLTGERGQVLPIVGLFMALILGSGAIAIDYGSYYHAHRQLQSDVDAAALAAAQDLPAVTGGSVAAAQATATSVYNANLSANADSQRASTPAPTFPAPVGTGCTTSNCIAIDGNTTLNSIFGKTLGSQFGLYYVHAHAQAYVGPPGYAKNVNSAAVDQAQFDSLTGCPLACSFPQSNVTLNFDTSSGFPLLDLNSYGTTPTAGGTVPPPVMGGWIQSGDPGALPVNMWYGGNTGQKNGVKNWFCDDPANEPNGCPTTYTNAALGLLNASVMIIPIFDQYDSGVGSYHVVGFGAFIIQKNGVKWNGSTHTLTGWLVKYIAQGLPAGPSTGPNFGVFVVGING